MEKTTDTNSKTSSTKTEDSSLTVDDFKKGDSVTYVPSHAHGDINHPDCQNGVVKRTNEDWVFVIYDNLMCIMTTGDEPYTAQATSPNDLRKGRLAKSIR